MNNTNKIIIGIAVLAVAFASIVFFARPRSNFEEKNIGASVASSAGKLQQSENAFDFGTISMGKGKVSHEFIIKNSGTEAVTIGRIFTSCMCTTVSLTHKNKKFGPFGMEGMGALPKINEQIAPNEEAIVQATFDPAAHGPSGVGKIQRVVTVENNAGSPLEFQFSAFVEP